MSLHSDKFLKPGTVRTIKQNGIKKIFYMEKYKNLTSFTVGKGWHMVKGEAKLLELPILIDVPLAHKIAQLELSMMRGPVCELTQEEIMDGATRKAVILQIEKN